MARRCDGIRLLLLFLMLPGISMAQGEGVVTAREHFDEVVAAARSLASDADLVFVESGDVDQGGETHIWKYYFRSVGLDRVLAYEYRQDDRTVRRLSQVNPAFPISLHAGMTPIPESWVDSPQALAEADANGGNDFRNANAPNYHVEMFLLPPPGGGRNLLFKEAAWFVLYSGIHGEFSAPVDAATGSFLDFRHITARTLFEDIESLAVAEGGNLELIYIHSEGVKPDGSSPRWQYYFQSLSRANLYAYRVDGGRFGRSYEPIPGSVHLRMPVLPSDWVDSDKALEEAERRGGSDFRQTHPEWVIEVFAGTSDSGSPEWHVQYRSPSGDEWFVVDALAPNLVTARHMLEDVTTRSHQEHSDAQLVHLDSPGIDLEGRANSWSYVFKSLSQSDMFRVNVHAGKVQGAIIREGLDGPFDLLMPPLPDQWLDSDSAVAIAERMGGSEFRSEHPGANIDVMVRWQQRGITVALNLGARPIYVLVYTSSTGNKEFILDAEAGNYFSLVKTSARENLAVLEEAVQEAGLPEDAALKSVATVRSDSAGNARNWVYVFDSPGAGDLYEFWVLGGLVVRPHDAHPNVAPHMIPLPVGWMGSSVAMASIEANGGRAFRQSHPNSSIALGIHATADGVFWNAHYNSDSGMESFDVDATHYSVANEPIDLPERNPALQTYPNPFSSSANVTFTLRQSSEVSLVIFDILGRLRATVLRGFLPAGQYDIPLKAHTLEPGLYLFVLTAEDQIRRGQMIKVR